MVYNWTEILRLSLFPPVCRLCLAPTGRNGALCTACREELPWLTRACTGCAMPLPAETQATRCPRCQKTPPPLDRCQALFGYMAPVDQWIQQMKFRQDLAAAHLLGELLAQQAPVYDRNRPVNLLPVPLHPGRLRARGYNQSLEIARPLARRGYPLTPAVCRKHRATAAQSDLPARQRRRNVRGAFSVTGPVQGQHFLLLDDVLTTGATLNELARTLKNAGAKRVEARVIARTVSRENGSNG
ncbi:MAG: ComF family protein [Thiogranum sp.]